jgi:hypothetical protein
MVLSMASKSVILAILGSRRKNHLNNPLTFLTRNYLSVYLNYLFWYPQLRDQFLNPILSKTNQLHRLELYQ